jgi:hypothetical protein
MRRGRGVSNKFQVASIKEVIKEVMGKGKISYYIKGWLRK